MNKQIDIITDLLVDFDEMGFCPTTSCPDPDAYAIEWRNKMTKAIKGYRTDVAREIFAEIDKIIDEYSLDMYSKEWDEFTRKEYNGRMIAKRLAELKKKYESKGADDV